jgi:hypothetical protein
LASGCTNGKELAMGLWWEWSKYTLPSGKTVDDVKNLVATNAYYGLPSLGYTGIKVAADVQGKKGGVNVFVAYLHMSGQDYWQVLNCDGSKTDLDEILAQLKILHNDYF